MSNIIKCLEVTVVRRAMRVGAIGCMSGRCYAAWRRYGGYHAARRLIDCRVDDRLAQFAREHSKPWLPFGLVGRLDR